MITVLFDDRDIKSHYGLVLESFEITQPEPKIVTVDVPGRDGELDMSTAITGHVTYHNRMIHLQFGLTGSEQECEQKRNGFLSSFQMKKIMISFSHLEGFFYGTVFVDKITRENRHYTIFVRVNCEPYRYLEQVMKTVKLTTTTKIENFPNLMMFTTPYIETTGPTNIEFEKKKYSVQAGMHTLGIVFKPGMNTLRLSGTGQATISYLTGVL